MGGINYFRDYAGVNFSELTAPITRLLQDDVPFEWTAECDANFEQIKSQIAAQVKLYFVDYEVSIFLRCDASKIGCGAQLFQIVNGHERTNAFASKTFTEAEQRWSTIEQETFAAFWAMKRWESMLLGHKFSVLTDHHNILQLAKSDVPKLIRWRLQMQQFDYDVIHVAGADEKHAIADCLSRLHGPPRGVHAARKVTVAAVTRSAAKATLPSGMAKSFVPDGKTLKLVEGYHNTSVGHLGVRATVFKIKQHVQEGKLAAIPDDLTQHVEYVRKHCPLCQKLQPHKKLELPVQRRHLEWLRNIFEELSIDLIGPLPETEDGMRYIIAVIDGFSRFCFAAPCKDATAISAAKFIHALSGTFGYAKAYRWDNAGTFDNHLIKCLMELAGADRHPSVPFNPQSNGKIERAIGEIVRHLKFVVNDRRIRDKWDDALPIALRIMNDHQHAAIGCSPARIMFPMRDISAHMYPVTLPESVTKYLKNETADKTTREIVTSYVSNLVALQAQTIKRAQEFEDGVVQHRVLVAGKEGSDFREFKVGDWVVCPWRGGKPTKLHVKWRGPYRVKSRESYTQYTVEDPADLKQYKKHVRELFSYAMGLTTDPRDVIAMDEAEALVDRIVEHNFPHPKRKQTWMFRIRWQGCDESEDTWLPFKEVNPLAAFETYLSEHKEIKL
jgi:hypothetical protein